MAGNIPRGGTQAPQYNLQQNGAYGTASQGLGDAMNGAYGAMNAGAPQADLTRTGGAAFATNRDLKNTNLNQYMNQYDNQVMRRATNDMDRARQIAMNDVGASATAARAFGGDRHGIVEGETNRGFANAMGDMSAGLRQAGFNNAQNMAQQDINRDFNRSQFNANAKNANRQFNAANANQNAMFNAGQQSSANNQRLAGAGLLGSLAGQSFNTGRTINQDQSAQGAMQQALMQQIMNSGNQQFNDWKNQPQSALQLPLQALGMTPYGQTSTSTSTSNPGFFDYLTAGAQIMSPF